MHVGVDEAGRDGPADGVDDPCVRPNQRPHFGLAADREQIDRRFGREKILGQNPQRSIQTAQLVANRAAQWPGSRVISAQKASTANAFSLDSSSDSDGSGQANGLALSTANLFAAVQPGGSLYGLQFSNPVDTGVAYRGPYAMYGMPRDPMVGSRVGGVNVFGGGLGLFAAGKRMVGALGVSGDTSCADHSIAWRTRRHLELDHLAGVGGVSGDDARPDNIVFDITDGMSAGGFGHPQCLNTGDPAMLPAVRPE